MLTLKEKQRISAYVPRISRALKAHFTLCFPHSGVWAEAGLTATGNARETRGKCVAFVICLCLFSVLFVFCVLFHFVKLVSYTKLCCRCMANEILAGPSHRSSDTHVSFSTEKQRISRALPARFPRIKNAFYTVFSSFRRLGRGQPDGHRTCAGNAREMRFFCHLFVFVFCLVFFLCVCVCAFSACQIGDLHKNVLQMHGE